MLTDATFNFQSAFLNVEINIINNKNIMHYNNGNCNK